MFSTLLRKVGFADRIYLCGALNSFPTGKQLCMAKKTPPPLGGLPKASALTRFQGIFADGTRLFILLSQLVEILISTKGVDKVDTLK